MEHQKIINMSDNTTTQTSKDRTKNWVEINHEVRGTYNKGSQIKFETTMLKLSLCDYSDACIFVKGAISVAANTEATPNRGNKHVIFRIFAPLSKLYFAMYKKIF